MLALKDLIAYLNEELRTADFDDYCPNGLQVEGRGEVKKLVTAVSASLETIEAAADSGADALLVHHGMFWKGDSFVVSGTKRKKIQKLLDHGISLFAYHLPLDAHEKFGNNWKAAKDLGWSKLKNFGDFNGTTIGVQGHFKECSIEDFCSLVQNYYGHHAHTALGGKDSVASAALISGGAHHEITQALDAGVDCFITGSYDEPIWHIAHEEGINFLALGHSATERVGPQALGQHLADKFKLDYDFLDMENPF